VSDGTGRQARWLWQRWLWQRAGNRPMAAPTITPASALRPREVRLGWRTVPLGGVLQRTAPAGRPVPAASVPWAFPSPDRPEPEIQDAKVKSPLRAAAPRQWSDPVGVQQLEHGRLSWIPFREVTPTAAVVARSRRGWLAAA
jgi:hypothetical protein